MLPSARGDRNMLPATWGRGHDLDVRERGDLLLQPLEVIEGLHPPVQLSDLRRIRAVRTVPSVLRQARQLLGALLHALHHTAVPGHQSGPLARLDMTHVHVTCGRFEGRVVTLHCCEQVIDTPLLHTWSTHRRRHTGQA